MLKWDIEEFKPDTKIQLLKLLRVIVKKKKKNTLEGDINNPMNINHSQRDINRVKGKNNKLSKIFYIIFTI